MRNAVTLLVQAAIVRLPFPVCRIGFCYRFRIILTRPLRCCALVFCAKKLCPLTRACSLVFSRRSVSALKKTLFATEQDRPDVAYRRTQWKKYQKAICADRLVFIDETWAKTNMTPTHGWGPRGHPLRASAPGGHWKTMTFIAALRHDRIVAPGLL